MKEFASALLIDLARRELARRGLEPPCPSASAHAATAPLGLKRDLLARAAARHGLLPLMEAGRGLERLPADPVLEALARSVDPHDVLARWRRLERFLHSRHRLVAEEQGPRRLVIRHAGPPADPPRAGEDALVLGALAELCRRAGARGLQVALIGPDRVERLVLADDRFREPPTDHDGTGLWRFSWDAVEPRPSNAFLREAERETDAGPDPARFAARAAAVIADDPSRGWKVSTLAGRLALSERTLQRRLGETGATLPGIVRAARVKAAGRLLIDTSHDLAKVGFVCGFSDQAHFTKLFKRQTALTPAAFRRAFRSGGEVR